MEKVKIIYKELCKYLIVLLLLHETVFVKIYTKYFSIIRYLFIIFICLFYIAIKISNIKKEKINKLAVLWFLLFLISIIANIILNKKISKNLLGYIYIVLLVLMLFLDSEYIYGKNYDIQSFIELLKPFIIISMVLSLFAIFTLIFKIGGSKIKISETVYVSIGYIKDIGYGGPKPVYLLYGYYNDTNHAAIFSSISLILSYLILNKEKQSHLIFKIINASNIIIQLIYIIFSSSRGIIVGFMLTIFILASVFLLNKIRSGNHWEAFLLLVIAVFLGIILISIFITFSRKDNIFKSQRVYLWKEALKMIKENFIFGVGLDGSKEKGLERPDFYFYLSKGKATHNSFLDLFLSYGIFVGTFTLFIVGKIIVSTIIRWNRKNIEGEVLVALLLIIFSSLFISCLFSGLNLLNALFIVLLGLLKLPYSKYNNIEENNNKYV